MELKKVDKKEISKVRNGELLNLHRRAHQLWSVYQRYHIKKSDYESWLIQLHDEIIVPEMESRNLKHNSPLT